MCWRRSTIQYAVHPNIQRVCVCATGQSCATAIADDQTQAKVKNKLCAIIIHIWIESEQKHIIVIMKSLFSTKIINRNGCIRLPSKMSHINYGPQLHTSTTIANNNNNTNNKNTNDYNNIEAINAIKTRENQLFLVLLLIIILYPQPSERFGVAPVCTPYWRVCVCVY